MIISIIAFFQKKIDYEDFLLGALLESCIWGIGLFVLAGVLGLLK